MAPNDRKRSTAAWKVARDAANALEIARDAWHETDAGKAWVAADEACEEHENSLEGWYEPGARLRVITGAAAIGALEAVLVLRAIRNDDPDAASHYSLPHHPQTMISQTESQIRDALRDARVEQNRQIEEYSAGLVDDEVFETKKAELAAARDRLLADDGTPEWAAMQAAKVASEAADKRVKLARELLELGLKRTKKSRSCLSLPFKRSASWLKPGPMSPITSCCGK